MTTVSVIIPVLSNPDEQLLRSISSVIAQEDRDWQLLLVRSDGTPPASFITRLGTDHRVTMVDVGQRCTVAEAINAGITKAQGEVTVVLRAGDTLRRDASSVWHDFAVANQHVDLIYSDEQLVDSNSQPIEDLLKPEFSIERLRSQMYLGRAVAYRTTSVRALPLREDIPGAEDHDLALRISEIGTIARIPQSLYRRRSTARPREALLVRDNTIAQNSIRAISDHLGRIGLAGSVEWQEKAGTFRVRRDIIGEPLVSIIIPTRGGSAQIRGEQSCLVVDAVRGIIDKSSYTNVEFVIVADAVTPPPVIDQLKELAGDRLSLVWWDEPFNFSGKVNKGAINARGDYLLLLNDDVEVISSDWIEAMLGLAQQEGVGLVGALLYFEDESVQHGGHLYSGGGAGHIGFGWAGEHDGLPGSMTVEREVSGVTAACVLAPRGAFFAAGGFTRLLPSNFNDVDFCMKVTGLGYKILWTPHTKLYHFESKSRVSSVVEYEVTTLYSRWQNRMAVDPYWPTETARG